ncbi:MAG: hypothetical protein KKE23_02935 [Nanoarchaeota archaeon]|nr:hypothetical protein [Nanoarchaeota archaeon]
MVDKFQRQTAYKMQIADILKGKINFEADRLNNVDIGGKLVLRVNVIANVVEKYTNPEKQFASLTLDDGSGQIRMKGFSDSFELLNSPLIGETVYVVGTLKFYNDELYILPEIINNVETKWLMLRRLELGIKESLEMPEISTLNEKASENKEFEKHIVTEQKIDMSPKPSPAPEPLSSPKLKVLNQIRKDVELDVEQLIVPLNIPLADLNVIVKELIQEGEIYESRPGHLCAMI